MLRRPDRQVMQLLGRFWARSQRPGGTMKSIMSSVVRTFWTLGDTMNPPCLDGKEGVDGSSPSEGFIGSPRYGGDFCFPGSADHLARGPIGSALHPVTAVGTTSAPMRSSS